MLPVVKELVEDYVKKEDWKYRWAALKVVMVIAEGCKVEMNANILDVPSIPLNFVGDPNPLVRFGAISAIGQMCTDLMVTIIRSLTNKVSQSTNLFVDILYFKSC
jgi:hypothetical protein